MFFSVSFRYAMNFLYLTNVEKSIARRVSWPQPSESSIVSSFVLIFGRDGRRVYLWALLALSRTEVNLSSKPFFWRRTTSYLVSILFSSISRNYLRMHPLVLAPQIARHEPTIKLRIYNFHFCVRTVLLVISFGNSDGPEPSA